MPIQFAPTTWFKPASGSSSAGLVPYVSPHVPRVARRNRSPNGSTAEADAPRSHLNDDGSVWKCFRSRETKGESTDRPAALEKRNESARLDSIVKGNCGCSSPYWTVLDSHYKCQIARNPMIPLVAGGGFEPPTFGL